MHLVEGDRTHGDGRLLQRELGPVARNDGELHARPGQEVAPRGRHEVGDGDGLERVEALLDPIRSAPEAVLQAELRGAPRDRLQPPRPGAHAPRLQTLQPVLGDAVAAEGGDRVVHALAQAVERDARDGPQLDHHEARAFAHVVRDRDRAGLLGAHHQEVVEDRRAVRGEHVGQEVEARRVRVCPLDAGPAQAELRELDVVLQHAPLRLRELCRLRSGNRNGRSALEVAEVALHELQRRLRIDVPADHERGVVRAVPAAEEARDVLEGRGLDVGHRADGRPGVGMPRRVQRFQERLVHEPVGTVLVALPALVHDHVALVVELRLRHRREQEAHPIRFEPQRELQVVGRHGLVVVRPVLVRRAVQGSPRFLEQAEVVVVRHVFRALEEHVLEQVREPRLARLLARAPDVVVHVHGHDGVRVVFEQDDFEPVRENVLGVLEADRGHGHRSAGAEGSRRTAARNLAPVLAGITARLRSRRDPGDEVPAASPSVRVHSPAAAGSGANRPRSLSWNEVPRNAVAWFASCAPSSTAARLLET